jgi:diaminohydroxyphosphoribosylaminopyrimidine deaminase/5-amino-6-(5-phosphoribosylamino)uracil reductase
MLGPEPALRSPVRSAVDEAWELALAAAQLAEQVSAANRPAAFIADGGRLLRAGNEDREAVVVWRPGTGWKTVLEPDDPRHPLLELYLPICSATRARPITVGHLGQSLDGFIATHTGESQYLTGEENIRHLHRMRALSDAVVVGAGTVAADDPQLTTRHVPGKNPLRVVVDPGRRLGRDFRLFEDDSAETLYVCASELIEPGETHFGQAAIIGIGSDADSLDVHEVLRRLWERDCTRIFVEGGGVTVSAFLEANALDRVQVAIAPLIIGDGRPAIRLPARAALRECHRPRYRVFRMGTDVMFDCDLTDAPVDEDEEQRLTQSLVRVI